jgi:large subunit ribosomal protein L17
MLRNLVCSLIEHGRVKTTVPKAKESRRLLDRCITFAKKGLAAETEVKDRLPPLRITGADLRKRMAETKDEDEQRRLCKELNRNGKQIAALSAKGLHYRRLIRTRLHQKAAVDQLFEQVAPRYLDRPGGFSRILRAGFRKGDNASVAIFELV